MTARGNDDLCTPPWIVEEVNKIHRIAFDPCSNEWSRVGADRACDIRLGQDGLAADWFEECARAPLDRGQRGAIFVNPPYSRPLPWARKIAVNGTSMPIFALVKCAPSTRWWDTIRGVASARCDFDARITFIGGAHKSGMMDSTMFYCGPSPYLFAHVFAPHGEVRVYR